MESFADGSHEDAAREDAVRKKEEEEEEEEKLGKKKRREAWSRFVASEKVTRAG